MHEMERMIRKRLRVAIAAEPEYLLEHDAGPVRVPGDLFLADLIGQDGQIDREWTIPEVRSELLVPIPERASALLVAGVLTTLPQIRAATYVLQSNYATMDISDEVAWSAGWDVRAGPPRFASTVVLLRYRLRL